MFLFFSVRKIALDFVQLGLVWPSGVCRSGGLQYVQSLRSG